MNLNALLLGLLCCATVQAETAYRFNREIRLGDSGKPALVAVPLDTAVYRATTADFRDLAIVDQQNQETAYLLQKIAGRKAQRRRMALTSSQPTLETRANEGIALTVTLEGIGNYADGITLNTQQHDFEYSVRVEGSLDGHIWVPLVEQALIYDYSRYMAVGKRDIALPSNHYQILRISIDQPTQTQAAELTELTRTLRNGEEIQRDETTELRRQPLHIDGIELWRLQTDNVADAEQVFSYAPTAFKVSQDQQNTLIDIIMDNQPLNGFELDVATPSFSRHAEVQVPIQQGIETRMQILAADTLKALRFREIQQLQDLLAFPEQRRQNYRIVIADRDNPALTINNVIGKGPGYQLVFLSQPGQQYRLFYGADLDSKPSYDTDAILQLQRRGYSTETASLGPEIVAPTNKSTFDFAAMLNNRAFLGTAIVLMLLALAWSLYKIGKRIGEMDE